MRDLARRGVVSIRFFPINVEDKAAWLSSPAALEVWTLADELGLVVDLEAPPYDAPLMIPVVEAMADRFPDMAIVLDHLFMRSSPIPASASIRSTTASRRGTTSTSNGRR